MNIERDHLHKWRESATIVERLGTSHHPSDEKKSNRLNLQLVRPEMGNNF